MEKLKDYVNGLQEVKTDDQNRIVYTNGTTSFIMLNMGEYVGHTSREYYDDVEPVWKLMGYEHHREDGKIEYGEALIDEYGQYSRMMVDIDNIRRVLYFSGQVVLSDDIFVADEEPDEFGISSYYNAFTGSIYLQDRMVSIKDYTARKHEFVNPSGQIYEGIVPDDSSYINFYYMNYLLRQRMEEGKKVK